jgi:hypothetical protein
MAGGQERILRRRIKSVQSTRKITKAMELIAASQIVRSPGAHHRQPSLSRGHAAHHRRGGQGRPGRRRQEAPRHARARSARSWCWSSPATADFPAPTTPRHARRRAPGAKARTDGTDVRSTPSARRPAAFYRFRGIEVAAVFVGMSRTARVRRRPARRRHRRRALRRRRGPAGADGLDPLPLGRHPERRGRAAAAAPAARRCPVSEAPAVLEGYTEFEPEVAAAGDAGPKALESEIFSALLEARRPSTPASSAPWPPPPRTPTSSSRP